MDRFKAAWQQQPLEGAAKQGYGGHHPNSVSVRRVSRVKCGSGISSKRRRRSSSWRCLAFSRGTCHNLWRAPARYRGAGVCAGDRATTSHADSSGDSAERHGTTVLRRRAERIDNQIALLSSVGTWYVRRCWRVSWFSRSASLEEHARCRLVLIAAIMGVVIYWANQRAVTRDLLPIRADLLQTMNRCSRTGTAAEPEDTIGLWRYREGSGGSGMGCHPHDDGRSEPAVALEKDAYDPPIGGGHQQFEMLGVPPQRGDRLAGYRDSRVATTEKGRYVNFQSALIFPWHRPSGSHSDDLALTLNALLDADFDLLRSHHHDIRP